MAVTILPTNATRISVAAKTGSPRKRGVDERATWLTRADASDLLGCTQNTLLNYERRGKLHPARVERFVHGCARILIVYDPKELAQLPRKQELDHPGERAARAFQLFDDGLTDRAIVVELRETPDYVRDHRQKWLDGGGADLVITIEARKALEEIVGPFAGVPELVAAVQKISKPPA